MSFSDEHVQIIQRYADQIGDIPVAYPNVDFTQPEPKTVWTRINIIDGEMNQTSIGDDLNNHRVIGLVMIQIFGEENKGTGEVLAMADAVTNIFRNWCGTTVRCRAASVKDIGPDGYGWYGVNVTIPFTRNELL